MHHVIIKSQGQDVQPYDFLILRIGILFVTSIHQFIFTNPQMFLLTKFGIVIMYLNDAVKGILIPILDLEKFG